MYKMRCKSIPKCLWEPNLMQSPGLTISHCLLKTEFKYTNISTPRMFSQEKCVYVSTIDLCGEVHMYILFNTHTPKNSKCLSIPEGINTLPIHVVQYSNINKGIRVTCYYMKRIWFHIKYFSLCLERENSEFDICF